MAWQIVKIDEGKKCVGIPGVSVGFGRMALNVAACNLIDNYGDYKYVELLTDPTRPSVIGVRLLKDSTFDSISIKRKVIDGKVVGGMEIASQNHMEKLFGVYGTQKKTTHYPVTKDKESENVLIITLKAN